MTDLISDLYKDAYGSRPSSEWLRSYEGLSTKEQEKMDEYLQSFIEADIQREKDEEAHNYNVWFNSIGQIAASNNVSFGTAIRWDMEAHDVDDVGYYVYKTGIGYSNEWFINQELSLA